MALLRECRDVFREHHDARRFLLCGLAEGVLLQRVQKFREAREAYLLLLAAAPDMKREDSAALQKVIGLCSIEIGDFAVSEASISRAIALYRELGQPVEVLKAETALGRLYIRRGDIERGIVHLRPVRRAFLQHAMAEEAGICALEIIEGMLAQGKAPEAERLARLVIREFTWARLSTRAITALGYLSEAIAARQATRTLVGDIRDYIVSLRLSPEREFEEASPN
jgi:tetratricopeptide (TPR) repeat protein